MRLKGQRKQTQTKDLLSALNQYLATADDGAAKTQGARDKVIASKAANMLAINCITHAPPFSPPTLTLAFPGSRVQFRLCSGINSIYTTPQLLCLHASLI